MVKNALDRLDARLIEAGHPGLREQLGPGRSERDVRRELDGMGLSAVDDLVAWFTYHDGGWLEPDKRQLLSLDEAIDHRMDLSQDLLVPFKSSWFPILTDSTESHVVDTAGGAFLLYDLETGDDEARQLERSFTAWIDSIAKGPGGRFGVSTGYKWSKQWSPENTEELKDEAQRALRGLAGLARRAADWMDDKEAKLGEHQPDAAPQAGDGREQDSGPVEADAPDADTPATGAVERVATVASFEAWTPARGEIGSFLELVDGRIVAIVKHPDGTDLYVLDLAQGLTAELIAEMPETIGDRSLSVSPVAAHVLVNGAWLYDLDSKTGGHIEGLFGQPYKWGEVNATWTNDGRHVHLHKRQHEEIASESPEGKNELATIGALSQVFNPEAGTVDTHQLGDLDGLPALFGGHLVSTVDRDGEEHLRVETIDGTELLDVPGITLPGARRADLLPEQSLLSKNGATLAIPTSGQHHFVLVDLRTGATKAFEELHPQAITADGSTIFAIKSDYPTSECFMVNTTTHGLEPFGSPQVEDAKFDWSADGTRFAHHIVGPDRTFGIEYIDWSLGVSSFLAMTSDNPYDTAVAILFCGDAVVFYDHRSTGHPTYAVSRIEAGQLGAAIDIGDDARAGTTVRVSNDQEHIVWETDQGMRWCSPDGSGFHALPLGDGQRIHDWCITRSNQIVVNTRSEITLATMS